MLTLTRQAGDSVIIGHNIRVLVKRIDGNRVIIGVDAPKDTKVLRNELAVRLDVEAAADNHTGA